jgi:hypothetical protein
MKTKIVGALITIFWLTMMVLLVKNTLMSRNMPGSTHRLDPSTLAENWRDYEEWMLIGSAEKPQGASMTEFRRLSEGAGYAMTSRLILPIQLGDFREALHLAAVVRLNSQFTLSQFRVRMTFFRNSWQLEGLVQEKNLLYKIARNSHQTVNVLRIRKPLTLLEGASSLLTRNFQLEVGKTYRIDAFDPLWMFQKGEVTITVAEWETINIGGRSYGAYRIETQLGNFTTASWVDEQGRTLRRQLTSTIVMEITTPDIVIQLFPEFQEPLALPELTADDFQSPKTGVINGEGVLSIIDDGKSE